MAERAAALQTYTAKLLKTREEAELKKRNLQEEIEVFGSEATQLQNEIENLKDKLKVYKEEKKTKEIEIDNLVKKLNGYENALSKIVESAQIMSQVSEKNHSV